MAQQIYQWLAQDGGVWSLAANWSNITSTPTPATTPPGAQDEAMITGATGSALTVITGGGTAALAEFTGNCDLTGSYQFGSLSLGTDGNGGLLGIASSASLTCANATIASGSLLATASTITVSSTLTLGTGQFGIGSANAILNASHGATITLGQLVLNATAAAIAIDSDSSVEIGTLKDGTAGALTIDTGHSLSGEGDAQAYGQIVNNGTITAQNGSLMVGTLTGAGLLDIAASATLILNGRTGAGQSIGFTGANASLAISAEIDGPQGTLTGFGVGDTIDELYSPITGASYTPGSANSGTLTLSYGGQTAQKLILAGNYSGYVFLTASDGAGGTIITTAQAGTGGGTTSPGTPTQNTYLWSAAGSGAWNNAANWTDQTTSATPAAIAPGHLDLVTITGATQGSFTVITGPAAAAALTITGGVATTGTITAAALALGTSLGGLDQGIAGTLDILGGSIFTTANATITDGAITVTGNGAKFTDSSTLTMGGGNLGVGLPVTALSAGNGAVITLGGLTMGGGSSDFLTTDPVS